MSTTSYIRRHLNRLPLGRLFSTRELLIYGKRAAVDQTLFRMVRQDLIVRVARGIFVKYGTNLGLISIADVAKTKAEAFGRRLAVRAASLAREFGLIQARTSEPVFWVNSGSSSFQCGKTTVIFKRCCARKIFMGETIGMKAMKALWFLGKDGVGRTEIQKVWERCGRIEREEIRCSLKWLPYWLGDYFVNKRLPMSFLRNYPLLT